MKLKLNVWLVFAVLLQATCLYAQPDTKDSLKIVLQNPRLHVTKRVDALNQLAYQYYDFNDSLASTYAKEALILAKQANYAKGLKYSYTMVGLGYSSKSLFKEAIRYYRLSNQVDVNGSFSDKVYNWVLLGNCYRDQAFYDSALYFYRLGLNNFDQLNTHDRATIYKNIGSVYVLQWRNQEAIAVLDSASTFLENGMRYNKYVQMDVWSIYGQAYKNLLKYDRSNSYYEKMCDASYQLEDFYHQIMCKLNKADLAYERSDYTSSLNYGFQALKITEKYVFPPQYVKVLIQIGQVYEETAQYDIAADYLFKALKVSERLGLRAETATIYSELAWIKKDQRDFIKSIEYADISLRLRTEIGDQKGIANCHNVKGLTYLLLKNFDRSIQEHELALQIRDRIQYQAGIAASLFNISLVYENRNQLHLALEYQRKSTLMEEKTGNNLNLALSYITISRLLIKLGQYNDAMTYMNKADRLADQVGSPLLKRNNVSSMILYYEQQGNYRKAYALQKIYQQLTDSIYSQASIMKLAEAEALYNTEKKEKDIELLNEKQLNQQNQLQYQQAELSRKNWIIASAITGIILLLTAGLIGYRYYKEKSKANKELREQQEEIQAQSEELQEANYMIANINRSLEEKVETRTSELKQAYKELDTFFYRSSHDFRRPITTFLGLAGVAKITVKDPVSLELFEKVSETAGSLDKMLQKLQSISDVGSQQMIYKDVFLDELVRETMEGLADVIKRKGIQVRKEIKQQVPFVSYPAMVKIILENLIENSVHFAITENPFLKVVISVTEAEAIIEVQDNGEGILEEYQSRIFEMYFRANERSKGNGLGLYIARKAAEKLNGTISFVSAYAKGSTFTVRLPNRPL
ncbi:MAG: tetratricopeptide repeat-containing sensor histidine kinase [Bacteroidetes bacterium]|nr:tetratricopeptide repeat-containing sensor histidine kinase [Bacteroidota bacterium]